MLERVAQSDFLSEELCAVVKTVLSSPACLSASFLCGQEAYCNASRSNSGLDLDLACARFDALRVSCEHHPELKQQALEAIQTNLLPFLRRRNFPDVEVSCVRELCGNLLLCDLSELRSAGRFWLLVLMLVFNHVSSTWD